MTRHFNCRASPCPPASGKDRQTSSAPGQGDLLDWTSQCLLLCSGLWTAVVWVGEPDMVWPKTQAHSWLLMMSTLSFLVLTSLDVSCWIACWMSIALPVPPRSAQADPPLCDGPHHHGIPPVTAHGGPSSPPHGKDKILLFNSNQLLNNGS